ADRAGGSKLQIALEIVGVIDLRMAITVVEPVRPVAGEQAAAMPAVALGKECQRFQVWSLGARGPGSSGFGAPLPVHREVDQVLSIGRQIAAALVYSSPEPLAWPQVVMTSVPL